MLLNNQFTVFLVKIWNKLRWDVHETMIPVTAFALLMVFLLPLFEPLPSSSLPIIFYVVFFLWNILTVETYVPLSFSFELCCALIYFILLFGCVFSSVIVFFV